MKLRAKLVYVRDHDLQQGDEGVQKILQFQTAGGGDIRLALLVHTAEHAGHPEPTVHHPRQNFSDVQLGELMAKGKARLYTKNAHMPEGVREEEVVVLGDEGSEYEITIAPVAK